MLIVATLFSWQPFCNAIHQDSSGTLLGPILSNFPGLIFPLLFKLQKKKKLFRIICVQAYKTWISYNFHNFINLQSVFKFHAHWIYFHILYDIVKKNMDHFYIISEFSGFFPRLWIVNFHLILSNVNLYSRVLNIW